MAEQVTVRLQIRLAFSKPAMGYAWFPRVPSRQSVEQFYQAHLIGITHRGLAIQLDPFGMLDSQIVVNPFSELGIGVDFVRHNHWPDERFQVCRGTFPPRRRRNGRPAMML